jgi:DnaK suppressor protein
MVNAVAAALAAKRAELEAEVAALTAGSDDVADIGFGKRVGEGTSIAVDRISVVAAHARLGDMLADVVRAEAKLAEGTYGTCDRCGASVSAARLEALPWASLCVACAAVRHG